MFFRQFLNDETACASYLFGCNSAGELAVVDPHVDLVDDYIRAAEAQGSRITAVLETHLQADHVSGLPELVERTGAAAYFPAGAGVDFEHTELADGENVELGNTTRSRSSPAFSPPRSAVPGSRIATGCAQPPRSTCSGRRWSRSSSRST